ncbi:arsenate reductase (glutaredoxin) [Muriicola sp.]|uniref:arsenate reductase (glutaredoxin) n=1 Tax=Muriicola sp. TaxID=2020856 RepID=UPI003C70DA47
MLRIYHNPRCRKSREGLALLEASGKTFDIVYYLNDIPNKQELKQLIYQLGIEPIELVRTQEAIWKSEFKGKNLTQDMILEAMCAHPKLIERPIVILNDKAVIGRPTENISRLLID